MESQHKKSQKRNFSIIEQIIVSTSRLIKDGDVVFAGVGVANVSSVFLAKLTHAPRITIIFETGIIRTTISRLPQGVDDIHTQRMAEMLDDILYVNFLAQSGWVDVGLLGAGQIDRFGNLNSTCVGDYEEPTLRFAGSGGAPDILGLCRKTIFIIPKQTKNRFREKVDFISGVGNFNGIPGIRSSLGLPQNSGPYGVITNLGTYSFDQGEMLLETYHRGISIEEIMQNTGWRLKVSGNIQETFPPSEEELKILREILNPEEIFSKGLGVI